MDVFCERCGTRQPIETAPDTRKDAKKTMGRLLAAAGLTNPAVSRSVFEDQFLRLCLSCRGYSCPQCWNEEVGLCQTCVPLGDPVVPLPVVQAPVEVRQEPQWPTLEHEIPGEPSSELPLAAAASAAPFVESPAAPPPFEPSIAFVPEPGFEYYVAPLPDPEPEPAFAEPEPVPVYAEPEPEPVYAEPDPEPAYAEPDPEPAYAEPDPEPAYAEPQPEPVFVEPEPEPVYAEPDPEPVYLEPQPEPVFVEPEPVPVYAEPQPAQVEPEPEQVDAEPEPEPALAEPEPDVEPYVAPLPEPEPFAFPTPPPAPVFPPPVYTETAAIPPVAPLSTPLGLPPARPMPPPAAPPRIEFDVPPPPAFVIARERPAPMPQPAMSAPPVPVGLFEQTPVIRPCQTCKLPLSAKARFCRRCGTSQG